jgi:glycosyltransferase involved in cell wall biosynthesis
MGDREPPAAPGRRVLQVIDSLARAGAEQSLVALAPHLVVGGVDLHVAYLVERDDLRPELERIGVPVTSLTPPDGRRHRQWWYHRLRELIAAVGPDVVHTTLFEADLTGRRAAAHAGVPCVSSLVNSTYDPGQARRDGVSWLKLRAAQAADVLTARRVARFHAVTDHVARVMSRRLLVPRSRIEVIPRGRDPEALGRRDPARARAVRAGLGVPETAPLVLAVGRQEPQKGFDVLLRALPQVRARFPDLRVLVAGREGRATGELAGLVAAGGLGDAVTFLGVRDDVPDLLAAADVFAFPSLREGAGGTLLEAMALECPVVASGLPTLREVVDPTTARLVRPGDADDLARGLVEVLADPAGAATRARAARARFERGWTVQATARRWVAFYDRVVREARGAGAAALAGSPRPAQ